MSSLYRTAKNRIKYVTCQAPNVLCVKLGSKEYKVPHTARMLHSGELLYLSFKSLADIFMLKGDHLVPVTSDKEAEEAMASLLQQGKKAKRSVTHRSIPPELDIALRNTPEGYRIGYGPDGSPRLVKTRKRTKK